MIVEKYSADVCCDAATHLHGQLGGSRRPATFVGRNKRETDRQRRAAGWIKIDGADICPLCAKQLRKTHREKER